LLLFYANTTFYKATVLVIKSFIDVEKEQIAPVFLFKLCTFCWLERKEHYLPLAQGTLATPLIAVD